MFTTSDVSKVVINRWCIKNCCNRWSATSDVTDDEPIGVTCDAPFWTRWWGKSQPSHFSTKWMYVMECCIVEIFNEPITCSFCLTFTKAMISLNYQLCCLAFGDKPKWMHPNWFCFSLLFLVLLVCYWVIQVLGFHLHAHIRRKVSFFLL
jgi:hypothetical protein